MKIAVAQIKVVPGNPQLNTSNIIRTSRRIMSDSSPNMIVFPELSVPGYLMGDIWEEQSFINECMRCNDSIIRVASDLGVIISFGSVVHSKDVKNFDGRYAKYNSVLFPLNFDVNISGTCTYLRHNDGYGYISKTLLPNYREFDEPRHFTPNRLQSEGLILKVGSNQCKIGVSICEDGWDDDYHNELEHILPMKTFKRDGVDLLINHSCSPFTSGKNEKRNRVFGNHAKACNAPLIYVNAVGLQNNGKTIYAFDGCSVIYDSNGDVVYQLPMYREGAFEYCTETKTVTELYVDNENSLTGISSTYIGDIYHTLIYGIREYCQQSGIERVVIGSSGGVDSAVSAALHMIALGSHNVYLVNMPSNCNSITTINASALLAKALGVNYVTVPIQDSVDYTINQINDVEFNNDLFGTTSHVRLSPLDIENIQARDRSSRVLSAISSALTGVFSNNGNKTELTVGYCTLYGDVCGYMAVLGDLWKSDVYLLGKYINYINGTELIPSSIFDLIPSAELSMDQSVDEGKGDPLVYWYHDRLFRSWVEDWNRKSPEEILEWYVNGTIESKLAFPLNEFGEYQYTINDIFSTPIDFVDDLENWWKKFKGMGLVKRVQSPPILAVSKRAFGFDYRESLNCCMFTSRYYELKNKLIG